MVELTINDQHVEVEEGTKLLRAIEKLGIKVPTLCDHKALSPYGACRLCIVEVGTKGRSAQIQASCAYPAEEGLFVTTETERLRRARKITAELLLARCPDSETIQRIAADLGVKEPRVKKKFDDCVYCGLCVRMCAEKMGRSAVGFSGRGPRKKVASPFGKHNPMCWTCGACNFICPVGKKVSTLTTEKTPIPIPNSYNCGLDQRSAAYILFPQAVPNKAIIDGDHCLHLKYGVCGICKEMCQAKAIDYDQKEEKVELNVGALILTPGYEVFDARVKPEFGYGRFPNVVSALEFERILSASGPYSGKVERPSDRKNPHRIAWLQCIGSRDSERDYCSSICCMYATKEAIIAKEHAGDDLECDIFFMDMRAFSKGFEEYFQRAVQLGITYIRCRPALIEENEKTGNLIVRYLVGDEKKVSREYDMVVLSVGAQPPKEVDLISKMLGIELNEFHFCETPTFRPVETNREGIYAAGPFSEPKDIPETVMQASGAAARVLSLLREERGSLIALKEFPPERDVAGEDARIGVFVCHCGTNIAGFMNVPEVVDYAKTLPNVVYAENNLYTCSNDTQVKIKEKITEYNLNRVVVASCTPRTHEPLFRTTLREAGLNQYLFEMANIRDQCSWVHMHEYDKATLKAKDLVRMAVAKSRLLEPLQTRSVPITKSALVIGAGVAGMTSALELSSEGYDVYLVEREKELGGHLRNIHYLINGTKLHDEFRSLVNRVKEDYRIKLFTQATIDNIEGSIGHFKTTVSIKGTSKEIEHGAVIVATGAQEYEPREYLYGEDERVLTQLQLEQRLVAVEDFLVAPGKGLGTIVMIQCVGSRDEERPYCSRLCCTEAVKNALKIKEVSPSTAVYVLYRDIRTYGFRESYYTKARQKGVVFIRYDVDKKPMVSKDGKRLEVEVFDQTLGVPLTIPSDLVILSTGIVANEDSKTIAQLLKIPLNKDGFFLEAHMKLRPVDFATDGVFLAGLAHSPKKIEESIIQGQAAAARTATILSKDAIELEGNISFVVDENCDGCAYCVDTCPYKAITLLEYMKGDGIKKTVEVNESVCKGCGCCMATCPKQGIYVKGFKLEQIEAQVNASLGVE
jgi:heterodisulfide reductase subunit A2